MTTPANHILLIAHAPLAHALRECALHVFVDCAPCISVLDVPPSESPELTLATAQALATQQVRHLTASRLAKTDDLPARRAEALRLDRGNPDAIAAWFAALGGREGVRVASNETQDAIATAASGADAWALADEWETAPVPVVPPPPIVSRAAFFQRLGVTPAEQADPVMQVAWQHLGLREYVDLRLAGAFLAPLVAVGKLTQARVDAALDASTVSWVERHLSL